MPEPGVAVPSKQAVVGDQWPPRPEPPIQRNREQSQPRPRPTPAAGPPAASHGGAGVPRRRTVTIRGVGAEAWAVRPSSRSRGSRAPGSASGGRRRPRAYERSGFRPDRVAMWAVLLGVVLVLVAAASSHAAQTLTPVHRPASPAAPLISAAQVRPPHR